MHGVPVSQTDQLAAKRFFEQQITDQIRSIAVESAETVRDRILMASKHIPAAQLGTTDDCGFSPFGDDVVTARDIAFAKIKARVEGSALAAQAMGL